MSRNVIVAVALAMIAAVVATSGVAAAPVCKASSGATKVPLVELYTSEGCDSCPPADRWLSRTFPREGGGNLPIALAFHVDYWDRLGWTDRFASPAFTERQYTAMRANGNTFVVTPQVLLQGHEFPADLRAAPGQSLERVAREPAVATIELSATADATGYEATATGRIGDAAQRDRAAIAIAYVDSGLVSDIKAGENKGAKFTHDHVVRALQAGSAAGASFRYSTRFARPAEAGLAPMLVAFVQNPATGDILQALALDLRECAK